MKFNFKTAAIKGLKGSPNNQKIISKLGYRDDSPYRNEPYIDIHTPNGQIDMSQTGIDLMANGRLLPAYSGMHQFDSNVVREVPLKQEGGEYEAGMRGMMKAKIANEYAFKNNPGINRMINTPDQPYDFGNGDVGTHFMGSYGDYAIPNIQDVNGKLKMTGPRMEEAIRFDRPEDAQYFAEHYKDVAPAFQKQDGGEMMELTDEAITWYKNNGYEVEDTIEFQDGGATSEYQKYQDNIKNKYKSYIGQSFMPDLSGASDEELGKWGGLEGAQSVNCIGSACNFSKEMGADAPIIAGNGQFWSEADSGEGSVDLYADSNFSDYADVLPTVQPGDFLGHDYPQVRDENGKREKGSGGRNGYYPEHSQLVLENNVEDRYIKVIDGYGGGSHEYEERTYYYDDINSTRGLINGGPNGKLFLGRPKTVNGEAVPKMNTPKAYEQSYIPNVKQEQIDNLKPLTWNLNPNADLDGEQLNSAQKQKLVDLTGVLTNNKAAFIKASGMSEQDYDDIARIIPGIAYQETKLGKTNPGSSKIPLGQAASNYIRGDYSDAFNTFKESTQQTAGSAMDFWTSKGDLQVKEKVLFKNPNTRAVLKNLGITEDNYDPENLQHNVYAALVNMDNVTKDSLKNFDKKEGNNKELSKTDKILYYYNAPGYANKGEAKGDLIYNKNVNKFSNSLNPELKEESLLQKTTRTNEATKAKIDTIDSETTNVNNNVEMNPFYEEDPEFVNPLYETGGKYEDVELTDDEIAELRSQGYTVEEL